MISRQWFEPTRNGDALRLRVRECVLENLKESRNLMNLTDKFTVTSDPVTNLSNLMKSQVLIMEACVLSGLDDATLSTYCEYDVSKAKEEINLRLEIAQNFMREQILNDDESNVP